MKTATHNLRVFTGIVQAIGVVTERRGGSLVVRPPEGWTLDDPLALGESVAVNGCCLTVVRPGEAAFDLSPETLARTALRELVPGDRVNLERSMRAMDRFGGHFVQGHVDATAVVRERRDEGNATVFRFAVEPEGARYLVEKGSIALDGVSLTIVGPNRNEFDVWVVPHTLEATNLGDRQAGDLVNVEYDLLSKIVERLTRIE